jgi:hypothetical protein
MDKESFDEMRIRFPEENSLFQDFYLIVDETQKQENDMRDHEWERSEIALAP